MIFAEWSSAILTQQADPPATARPTNNAAMKRIQSLDVLSQPMQRMEFDGRRLCAILTVGNFPSALD
jgi:hypothetical protein